MTDTEPTRTPGAQITWLVVALLLIVIAASATAYGFQSLASSSAAATATIATDPRTQQTQENLSCADVGSVGAADGVVPDGVTVFDDAYPAVANLAPALLDALRRAATGAERDGVVLYVNSGWRSPQYQEQLLCEAIAQYGSAAAAARWVAPPSSSAHVSGDAADIGLTDADAWLSAHGADYGLCQIYRNEPWHFELRTAASAHGCPPMYADAAHDPRMQQ
jgi:hypothetical protein